MDNIEFGKKPILDPRVYTGTQAVTTQSFTEANVKNGSQFYISEVFTLPQGSTKYFVFTTVNSDTIIKFREISCNNGLEYRVFRNPIISNLGTSIPIHNLNDKNPNSVLLSITQDPIVTSNGNQWDIVKAFNGQGNQVGGGVFATKGSERILNTNSSYLVEFTNTDNTDVDVQYIVSWYEGPLSIDIL